MLYIKTIKNPLTTDSEKNGYCFRSTCSETLDLQKLVTEMVSYNSSFTEADVDGMLKVLNTVLKNFLCKGWNVELPFGTLKANATGTCAGIQDGFTLGQGDHKLSVTYNPTKDLKREIKDNLVYTQIDPDSTGDAKIYRVTALNDDASESNDLNLSVGKNFRIHGRNLSFDLTDEKQGLFIENEQGKTRISSFTRRGTNIIDTKVPAGTASGLYSVYIVTKPGNLYTTANIDATLNIA